MGSNPLMTGQLTHLANTSSQKLMHILVAFMREVLSFHAKTTNDYETSVLNRVHPTRRWIRVV